MHFCSQKLCAFIEYIVSFLRKEKITRSLFSKSLIINVFGRICIYPPPQHCQLTGVIVVRDLIPFSFFFLEMEAFENWYPGTVSAAEGYNLLKMMLMKSMMNDQDIESFAKYVHCKLNY